MLDTEYDFETEFGPDQENPVIEFTAFDRCDACGVQAYTLAKHEDAHAELLFCLHHRKTHKDALVADGWKLIDDEEAIANLSRNRLIEEPAGV